MDGSTLNISPHDLYRQLGTASTPVLLDVRRGTLATDDRLIIGARRPVHELVGSRRSELTGRSVIVYCADGEDVSPTLATALRTAGIKAAYLEGGLRGWMASQLPTRKNRQATDKWVTREHPKIDRIACPWLVSRFLNPDAQFIYVPLSDVFDVATDAGATVYDVEGVEFGHVDDRCSFDAIMRIYDIHDPALDHVAMIVRGADTSRPDLTPQCEGLLAISYGLSANHSDHDMLRHGMVIYDALYTWCRMQAEKHRSASSIAA